MQTPALAGMSTCDQTGEHIHASKEMRSVEKFFIGFEQ
jgi:hypothetical protein